jgi:hypothetical protein
VAASVTRFYLSRDSILDSTDTALEGSRAVPTLATNGSAVTDSTNVRLPGRVAPGAYGPHREGRRRRHRDRIERDRQYLRARSIAIGPDLVVTSIAAPFSPSVGSKITVTDTWVNVGGGATGPFVVRYYLSASGFVNCERRL